MCDDYNVESSLNFKLLSFSAITTKASNFSSLSVADPPDLRLQSNSLLPESLRNSDKRRNGPEFSNDTKKRKVEDKDSSHYVRSFSAAYVCV